VTAYLPIDQDNTEPWYIIYTRCSRSQNKIVSCIEEVAPPLYIAQGFSSLRSLEANQLVTGMDRRSNEILLIFLWNSPPKPVAHEVTNPYSNIGLVRRLETPYIHCQGSPYFFTMPENTQFFKGYRNTSKVEFYYITLFTSPT
jgi:hypothetical protein